MPLESADEADYTTLEQAGIQLWRGREIREMWWNSLGEAREEWQSLGDGSHPYLRLLAERQAAWLALDRLLAEQANGTDDVTWPRVRRLIRDHGPGNVQTMFGSMHAPPPWSEFVRDTRDLDPPPRHVIRVYLRYWEEYE